MMNKINQKICSFNAFFLCSVLLLAFPILIRILPESIFLVVLGTLNTILLMTLFVSVVVCYFYNIVLAWKDIKVDKLSVVKFFLGPWMLIPQIILGTIGILSIYQRPMETGVFDRFLFFQGSIDMGGEQTFVATIALYILFGFIASWYATLKLEALDSKTSFLKMFIYLLRVLKYHLVIFFLWGTSTEYDDWIVPNDFRNMFLLVFFLYLFTMILIVMMRKLNLSRSIRLIIAPIFTVIWLIIGADGNTARAKQIPIWNDNPHYVVISKKHAIMIAWHNLCDDFFGDPKPHYTHQYPQ